MARLKSILGFIFFIFVLLLTTIQSMFMYGGYEPTGEYYVKTSPSSGDAGVLDVIDFETEHLEYDINSKVIATIGFGSKRIDYLSDNVYIRVSYVSLDEEEREELYFKDGFNKEDLTVYEEKSYLDFLGHYWYWYPHFYPNHKETVALELPKDVDKGFIEIKYGSFEVSGCEIYESTYNILRIKYYVIDGMVTFNVTK